jgi:hypothetical protein
VFSYRVGITPDFHGMGPNPSNLTISVVRPCNSKLDLEISVHSITPDRIDNATAM